MIKALHLDDRLIHGQVAISWTRSLDISLILIVNDSIVNDEMRKSTLRLGIPSGIKYGFRNVSEGILFLQNTENIKKFNIMVLVDNPKDAYLIGKEVEGIKQLSIGGVRKNAPFIHDNLNLTDEDVSYLLKLIDLGKPVGMQPTPGNAFVNLEEKLRQARQ